MPTAPPTAEFSADCEGREIFQTLTGRWAMLIILTLGTGPARFFELRDRIEGISEKMLAQTLRTLRRDGLLHRGASADVPPKVTYSLTDLGNRFHRPLSDLHDAIAESLIEVSQARNRSGGIG